MTAPTGGLGGPQGKHVTMALSAIIAAIWAGIWGFNWAATHLSADQLFPAIIIGLGLGTAMTVYVIERTFNLLNKLRPDDSTLTMGGRLKTPTRPVIDDSEDVP